MAKLSREQAKALLRKSSENRAKKALTRSFFSYFDPEKMKENNLSVGMFKKSEDPYFINIIPYLAGENDPNSDANEDTYVLKTKVHSFETASGWTSVICPRAMYPSKNLPCPICEKREELRMNEPENEQAIKALNVKSREAYFIENVTSHEEKAKGIQIMEVSSFFMGDKLRELVKPQKGGVGVKGSSKHIDISDYEDGRTVKFKIEENKTSTGTMPSWVGHELIKRDPIDDEIIDKILDLPPLDEMVVVKTYDELLALMNNAKQQDSDDDVEEDKPKKSPKKSPFKGDDDDDEEVKTSREPKKKAPKKKKEEFDYRRAEAEELEEFISENDVDIDEDDIGNERKMRLAIRKFLSEKKSSFKDHDDIDDIEEYIEELKEGGDENLIKFCEHHGIEYEDEEDIDDIENQIDRWWYSKH